MQHVERVKFPILCLASVSMEKGLCDASFAKLRKILHQTRTYPSPRRSTASKTSNKLRLSPFSPYHCFQIPDNSLSKCRVL
jgi:hypothetical protein